MIGARLLTLAASLLVMGCSSSDGDSPSGSGGSGGSPGAGGTAGAPAGPLTLPPPPSGLQLEIEGTTIEPGEDVEYCEAVTLPGTPDDVYYVARYETEMTQFSHHLNIYSVAPNTLLHDEVTPGVVRECLQPSLGYANTGAFGEGLRYVVGSQRPRTDAAFPEGIGQKWVGGQKVVFNFHYLNTSPDPVQAKARLNLHTVDEGAIERTPQMFAMLNRGISIPPMSDASFTMQCTARQEIDVYALTRHTHRWGTRFDAWWVGGDRDGEHLFTSDNWEADVTFPFAPPLRVKPGEGFRFRCDFTNTEPTTLEWGDKARDEMCILYGGWTVADASQTPQPQSCFFMPGFGAKSPDGVDVGSPMSWPPASEE